MMTPRPAVLACFAAVAACTHPLQQANPPVPAPSSVQITSLRCEGLTDPLGVDVPRPRLSWILEAHERAQRQSAYQIVAEAGPGVLWDSGQVASSQSVHVPWGGPPLASGQRIRWKVRVWDRDGRPTAFSAPATFEMGLLAPGDWRGEWIAASTRPAPTPTVPGPGRETRWIGAPEGTGEALYRAGFELPAGRRITRAHGSFAASGAFTVTLDGHELGRGEGHEHLTPIDVQGVLLSPGPHVVGVVAHGERPPRLVGRLQFLLDSGDKIDLESGTAWQARRGRAAGWDRPGPAPRGFVAARELGKPGDLPWGRVRLPLAVPPAPLLRKTFTVDRPVAAARVYVSGLGYFELHINGRKIGDHVLDPGFTRYDKRALYVTHDVTATLAGGRNTVGIILGNGWFDTPSRDEWKFDQARWRGSPRALVQLAITYTDGTRQIVASDDSWKTAPGPIVFDGIKHGEVYDARLERPRWAMPDEDEKDWKPVALVPGPGGVLSSQMMAPIKVTQTLAPRTITEPAPGVFVVDMGQNFAGWARLRVRGPRGQKIVLRYGERVDAGGRVDQKIIGQFIQDGPFQTDSYILKGEGDEVWEPRFVYHGFQYVEVTGWPGRPQPGDIDGRVVHTAFAPAGTFESSNELVNKLQRATLWSYRSNFHGVPTDCPHREKLGWTGDAHMATEQALFNWDNAAGYVKWARDLVDEQRPNGALPGVVPTGGWGYTWGNGPGWDSALLLVPWKVYVHTGDAQPLAAGYEAFKRYVDYVESRDFMARNPSGWLGDWLQMEGKTPEAVTHAGYHATNARIVAATARLLGQSGDAARYEQIAQQVTRRFQDKFFDAASGKIAEGSQTAQSTALYQDLVDVPAKDKVVARLVENVERKRGHLDVGTLGTKALPWALTANGRADLAYAMITKREFPGWGHWIEQGATTLWEDWKGGASRNHIFLGDISAWFYRALAGINPDPAAPGFQRIVFRPEIVGDLTWVRAHTQTVRGRVASAWRREGGTLTLEIDVPVGSTATVEVPAPDPARVQADGGRFVRSDGGRQIFQVESGRYRFVVR